MVEYVVTVEYIILGLLEDLVQVSVIQMKSGEIVFNKSNIKI